MPASPRAKLAMREGFGYEALTEVQAQTMGPILEGADVLVRAQTGAGKTLGFLLPMFERIAADDGAAGEPGAVRALVLSPIRELTLQVHGEAAKLAAYYGGLQAVSMVGGVPLEEEREALARAAGAAAGTVLVATPGRLEDHLASTPGLLQRLSHLRVLVLDEADQLAGEFFRPAVSRILGALPPPAQRQGLFFSATLDDAVRELASEALGECYADIDLVQPGAATAPEQIVQSYRLVETEGMSQALWESLQAARARGEEEEEEEGFKIVVLLTTARIAEYYAEVFRRTSLAEDVFEIHSRRQQAQRMEESQRFRDADRGVLFTSDVSARGLDYPGVAEVIQVGAPDSREDYLHRLGRTGRAGRAGRGLLLLHGFEARFLAESLADQPLVEEARGGPSGVEPPPGVLREPVAKSLMAEAYYSWLNHKLRNAGELPKVELVREAARFAASIGALDPDGRPPRITERNAAKMGLDGIKDPALNVVIKPKQAEVPLTYDVVPTAGMPEALLAALQLAAGRKAVVYCVTPFVASYFVELVRKAMPDTTVFEVHSKVSKAIKKKDLQSFKKASSGVLFSADASPQSVASPGVTDVIQVGAPHSANLQAQRLGLASQAGEAARALLLLHPFELSSLPGLQAEGAAPATQADVRAEAAAGGLPPPTEAAEVDPRTGTRAYFSWLEHYCSESFASALSKADAIREAKAFAAAAGALDADGRPPALAARNAARIGLAGVSDPDLILADESG